MIFKEKNKMIFLNYLLVFLLCWPFAHYFLSKNLNLNHWKFFGLAMYTNPPPFVDVEFASLNKEQFYERRVLFSKVNPGILREFIFNRTNWGYLYSPDKLANEILNGYERLKGLKVIIYTASFNNKTARPIVKVDEYDCKQEQGCKWVNKSLQ